MTSYLAALDIGTSSIKGAVASRNGDGAVLHALLEEPSQGLRRGAVYDLEAASSAVSKVIGEIKAFAKSATRSLYVNIGTSEIRAQDSRGIVAVSRADNEIQEDDVERAVKASRAVNLGQNRTVIHTVTREFIVDGVSDIASPAGLSGNRLEVSSLVIDAFEPHIKSLMQLVEASGGEVGGLVANPIAASRAALTKNQKELGVMLIELGAGTTSMAVYEEQKLLTVKAFPVGGANITSDIAVGLKVPVEAAEQLKLAHGAAFSKGISSRDKIELGDFSPEGGEETVSKRFFTDIIESRLAETFEFVNNELERIGKENGLPGGMVLTGGGAELPGTVEMAKSELGLSSHLGGAHLSPFLREDESLSLKAQDPSFACVLGLILTAGDEEGWWGKSSGRLLKPRIKNLLRNFLP